MRNAMRHRTMPAVILLVAFLVCESLCACLALVAEGPPHPPHRSPDETLLTSQMLAALDDQARWLVAAPSSTHPQRCQRRPLPGGLPAAVPTTLDLERMAAHGTAQPLGTSAAFFDDHVVSVAGGAIARHVIAIALAGIALEVVVPPG